jgi:hypothetical protein
MDAGMGPLASILTMHAVADLEEGLTMEVALSEPFIGLRIGPCRTLMQGSFHPPPSRFSRKMSSTS